MTENDNFDPRPSFSDTARGKRLRDCANSKAPPLIKFFTRLAIYLPLAGSIFILLCVPLLSILTIGNVSLFVIFSVVYGGLIALHFEFFRVKAIDTATVSSKAGALATFWAGYVAAYIAAFLAASEGSSEGNDVTGPSVGAVGALAWALTAFVPLLATMTQALVPEAFWPVSKGWQTRMLVSAAFMLFIHVSLSLILALVLVAKLAM